MPALIMLTVFDDEHAQLEIQRRNLPPLRVDFDAKDIELARAIVNNLARAFPDAFTLIDEV